MLLQITHTHTHTQTLTPVTVDRGTDSDKLTNEQTY